MAEVVQLSVSCTAYKHGSRCLCRKSSNHSQHHRPFSWLKVIVQKSHGPKCRVAEERRFQRQASLKRACTSEQSTPGAIVFKVSALITQLPPKVQEANGTIDIINPCGAQLTSTRSPRVTHRTANISRSSLACSFMIVMKIADALFHGLLNRSTTCVA